MTANASRLLLVEDEEAHAELIQRAFEDHGHVAVEFATCLDQARRKLSDSHCGYDLVITDLRLPDGLGTSLLDDCAARPPIVIMTSQGDERDAVAAIKHGAYDYVVKSVVAFEEMPRTAERVLREWRNAREKAELQRALAERERLASIGQTAAMLAHEIGNPLNTMILTTRVIERRLAAPTVDIPGVVKLVDTCRREIERLAELLGEFRELSRHRDLRLETVSVAELFEMLLECQRAALEAGNVEVTTRLPDEPLWVLANREKMSQVLINLCKNAIEAMPSGGHLELSANVASEAVTLTITDDGPGLEDGLDPFLPFATTKEQGTGLGLAVVAQILVAHGGLAFHERPEQGGARFCLRLRRA